MHIQKVDTKAKTVNVFLFSDAHVGNRAAGEDELKRAIDVIVDMSEKMREDGQAVGVYFLGDAIDAITISDKRFTHEAIAPWLLDGKGDFVKRQADKFVSIVKPAFQAADFSGFLEGNHEAKFKQKNDFDIGRYIADGLQTSFLGQEALVRVILESATARRAVDMYLAHGAVGGGWREGTAINALYDLSRYIDAGVYAMGHVHRLVFKYSDVVRMMKVGGLVSERKIYAVTGSFLKRYEEGVDGYMAGRRGEPVVFGAVWLQFALTSNSKQLTKTAKIVEI